MTEADETESRQTAEVSHKLNVKWSPVKDDYNIVLLLLKPPDNLRHLAAVRWSVIKLNSLIMSSLYFEDRHVLFIV